MLRPTRKGVTMTRRFWTAALLAGLLGFSGLGAPAADDKKDEKKGAPAAEAHDAFPDDVQQIALAYQLAEMGRRAKAPDLLVSAARILRRIKPVEGDTKPEVKGGEDAKGEKVVLVKESDKLLAEAKALAPDDKAVAAAADKAAKEDLVFPPVPGKRGTYGGPRSYHHQPGAGVTLTWNRSFV